MPDFGYNTVFSTEMEKERVKIIKGARKTRPDLKLQFRDNNAYARKKEHDFNFGFTIKMFLSDVEAKKAPAELETIDTVDAPFGSRTNQN